MPVPKIDLKIGGLVTSMQRSLLGDVSPPAHMDNSMGNSLITSNDFSNIDFMNETGDSLSMAHFKQYRLSDAIADRNFLERLTNYDESLFTKDADINNVDLNENGNCTGSSSSTLQNSTDSTNNLSKNNGTFVANTNGTFDASGEIDKTFIQAVIANGSNNSIKNSTFEMANKVNQTFEAQPTINKLGITIPVVADLDDEELSLCDSFNATRNIDFKRSNDVANNYFHDVYSPDMNSTFQLDGKQLTCNYENHVSMTFLINIYFLLQNINQHLPQTKQENLVNQNHWPLFHRFFLINEKVIQLKMLINLLILRSKIFQCI